MDKLYAKRDTELQEQFYTRHMAAMTEEDLHSKSDIAAELAHRDIIITVLKNELRSLRKAANVGDEEFSKKYAHLEGF